MIQILEDGVGVGLSSKVVTVDLFPWETWLLGADTGVGTEVLWEGNYDGH